MTQQVINPSVDPVKLREQGSAPSTAANEVKIYSKDVSSVSEVFIRKESNGAEVQLTNGNRIRTPSFVGSISRDLSAATGSVAYTGFQFKPSLINVAGGVASNAKACWGSCDAALNQKCIKVGTSGTYEIVNFLAQLENTDPQTLLVTSLDSDGFTGIWTKTSSPTGIGNLVVSAC